MNRLERLEDRRRDWQVACAPAIEACLADMATRLSLALPNRVGPLTPEQVGRLAEAGEWVRCWADERLVPRCLDWLRQADLWPDAAPAPEFARQELASALHLLPPFEPCPPEPALRTPTVSWALAAAAGAAAGMVLLTPLSLLLLGRREAGLVAGGILGSASVVALIGVLGRTPRVRAMISSFLAVAAAGSLVGGVWAYWRGMGGKFLRGGLWLSAGAGVVSLAGPRPQWPSRDEYVQVVCRQLRPHLRHIADLVLAWCWTHPCRLPAAPQVANEERSPLPSVVCIALADLHSQLACGDGVADDLRDAVEELLQRFEDDGYEWTAVAPNTPFEEAMKENFDTFGVVASGQPVRTRRAAIRRRGQLVRKGELRRV